MTHNSEAGSYAAVGATSFPNAQFTADDRMPSYLLVGQADISEALPDPVRMTWSKIRGRHRRQCDL